MILFGLDKVQFARKIEAFHTAMEAKFQAFHDSPAAELTEEQLLEEIDRLYPLVQETAYYNTVTAMSMRVYNRMLKGQLDRMDVDFESFDLTGGMQELQRFEPNAHLTRLHQLYSALDPDLKAHVRESRYGQLPNLPGAEALQAGIAQFLEEFGHLSDSSSDFSQEPWRENPDLILQMIINYVPPEGGVSNKIQVTELQLPALRRPLFMSIYNRARRFHWYREAVSSLYTFGYGLFRGFFLALGHHFVQRGLIAQAEDIFYLYMDEVREIVETGTLTQDCQESVSKRTEEIDRVRDITPPEMIFGDHAPPLVPTRGQALKGVPTSLGNYTGPARVLQGIQDMGKVQEGDVLVIPYSDVGWMPLFTKAGAVVAESGGILSHCSIIAREYGIPAVVSVTGACQLTDDTPLTVDGGQGEIIVHEPA
jgi:pyruvate,water dikinase